MVNQTPEITFEQEPSRIVAFVSDLMFSTRIANVTDHLGYQVEWLETAASLGEISPGTPAETLGESLHGREGQLFRQITDWQPVLLLFDLNNNNIPWATWIAGLKSSPSTRRIPIMCYGPHTNIEVMQKARDAGADVVLARSRFTADMGALFQKYARLPEFEEISFSCQEPLAELALEGIRLFNDGQYYACHDSLEEAWVGDDSPARDLYRAILQVSIAYYQIERSNYRGAVKMLLRMRQWLAPLPAICREVDVARLREDVDRVHNALVELGPDDIGRFDQSLFRPIVLQLSA